MNFIHPRFWPTWCIIGLIHLMAKLPFSWQMNFGAFCGRILKLLVKKRVVIARTNLTRCFPDMPATEREKIIDQHFEALGKVPFEFGVAAWRSDDAMRELSQVEGLENLEAALAKGHGALLLSGHFTTIEIVGRIIHLYVQFYPFYRKHNNPLMEDFIKSNRENICGKALYHDDMRGMHKALREKIPLYYIPDQNFGAKYSVFVPFFGIQTATITATSRLAKMYQVPVVPVVQRRLPDNKGYYVKFEKALENFPSDDWEKDAASINKLFEEHIKNNMSDYLWVHRRFKTRPEGDVPFYDC